MVAVPKFAINQEDLFTISLCNLDSNLPMFQKRSEAYLRAIFANNPHIVLIQSIQAHAYGLQSFIRNFGGTLIVGSLRHDSFNATDRVNAIWVDDSVELIQASEIPIELQNGSNSLILAPNSIRITAKYRGSMLVCYVFEGVSGDFHNEARLQAAHCVNLHAYTTIFQNPPLHTPITIIGATMYCSPENQAVQMIEGNYTRQGFAPAEWDDVFSRLHENAPSDKAVTQNLLADAIFDPTIVLPQFMQPIRDTFFFMPHKAFGRVGTPITIERNGLEPINNIPVSGHYGLTMQLYMPDKELSKS